MNEFYQKWGNGAPLSDRGLPDWTDGYDFIYFFDENDYEKTIQVALISSAVTFSTIPSLFAVTVISESRAALYSIPVPTIGASGIKSGTACLCMLDPIRERLTSSCSKNGIIAAATDTNCFGDTST